MTQPKVTEWNNGKGFYVDYGDKGFSPGISYANLPTLHAILTEKLAEANSRKWVAEAHPSGAIWAWGAYRQGEKAEGYKAAFYGTDAEKEARAYADRKNVEEGLA